MTKFQISNSDHLLDIHSIEGDPFVKRAVDILGFCTPFSTPAVDVLDWRISDTDLAERIAFAKINISQVLSTVHTKATDKTDIPKDEQLVFLGAKGVYVSNKSDFYENEAQLQQLVCDTFFSGLHFIILDPDIN
jgi:hypothetical protein